jgi:peptide/nickel transport system permease protein
MLLRIVTGIGVLWGAATVTFLALHLTDGDPALVILGGPDALPSKEVLDKVRSEYHLSDSIYSQYGRYLAKLASGDLGESYRLRIPVFNAITEQLPATLVLATCAGTTAILVSVTLALFTARRSNGVRTLISGTEMVLGSSPAFITGILLIIVFSFRFYLLPASGSHGWISLILPTAALALPIIGVLTQVLRNALDEIMEQPFILASRARGMSDTAVRLQHSLRHVMIPLVTLTGYIFSSLLGGAVIVETLFNRQGIGRLMVDAATSKDIPVVLGITLFSAACYVIVNLLVDLSYALIDPRVAAQNKS